MLFGRVLHRVLQITGRHLDTFSAFNNLLLICSKMIRSKTAWFLGARHFCIIVLELVVIKYQDGG